MTTALDDPHGWPTTAASPALGPDDIHVWRVSLVQPRAAVSALAAVLRDDERERAARFVFDRDRDAYTITRGTLRTLLGGYTHVAPRELAFGYRAKGKPYLLAPSGEPVRFNVSHSGQLGLLAFTRGREIGVDIEQRRALSDLLALAKVSFSPTEYAALCALPGHHHVSAFFAGWSRKEAFIKATGEGVSQLADFDVSIAPGEPARLLRVAGEPAPQRWSLTELPAIEGYAAALVVEGPLRVIQCLRWPQPGDR